MTLSALNYILGANPLRKSFVSGYGDDSTKNIYGIMNNDFRPGVPKGVMSIGPNKYENAGISIFPAKNYMDCATEWTTSEHAVGSTANLVFITAFANSDQTAPEITVTGVVYGTYNSSLDVTPIITLNDNLSGVDASKTTVTLDGNSIQQGVTIPLYTLPLGSHTFIVTASDLTGNTSSQKIVFQTTASIQSMQTLVTHFTNAKWIDNLGIANSLQSKLAANALAAFVNEVKAQSGKHITRQAADYLIRDAQYLLSQTTGQ